MRTVKTGFPARTIFALAGAVLIAGAFRTAVAGTPNDTAGGRTIPQAKDSIAPSLPFAWDATPRPHRWLDGFVDYPDGFDYPVRQVIIDGEVWVIHVPNPDLYKGRCRVNRYKGPDLDHLERLPDGSADLTGASSFLGCGMWWDEQTRTLYGLIHGEYAKDAPGQGWCAKKTRLATSRDMGLTWTLVGDVLTRGLPDAADYSGPYFEAGPADFDFYADVRGGYFYVTSWNSFVPKKGTLNGFAMFSEVARCAISDKMAPGRWFKYRDGAWSEPGLGGKASRVGFALRGIYGNTIYSSYLKKYLRIGIHIGVQDGRGAPGVGFVDRSVHISACTDLAKQDWAPMAKLLDEPANELFAFTLSDDRGRDPVACGRALRAYNYWQRGSRVLDIVLKEGNTPSRLFPPHDSYSYEAAPESGDRIESRKTRIAGAGDPDMRYSGGWTSETNGAYYQGRAETAVGAGQSVQFAFTGGGIYWRAVAAPDAGKADVFIDGVLEKTVDCFFPECPLPYLFAFIKTGLDPARTHTIKIVVRGDRNPGSSGTKIRHVAFEYAAAR